MEPAPRYLLIAGAPKCGTTSLFRYLADHPQVCPASRKESYFFARDYDFQGVCRVEANLQGWESYFSHAQPEQLRVEATPYTLYQQGAAQAIQALLPEARLVFILRDPVARLVSDYSMVYLSKASADAAPPSLEQVVRQQIASRPGRIANNVQCGCYAEYLRPFLETFGRPRVQVLFSAELERAPGAVTATLAWALGLEAGFYRGYDFTVHNPRLVIRSGKARRLVLRLEQASAALRAATIRYPRLYRGVEKLAQLGKDGLQRMFRAQGQPEPASPQVLAQLAEYYAPHDRALSELLGQPVPWSERRT